MGTFTMLLPDVGEGISEAELLEWLVKPGDVVQEDEILAVVMTDKVAIEVPSAASGEVLKLGGAVGEMLPIGSMLVRLQVEGEGNGEKSVEKEAQPAPEIALVAVPVPTQEALVTKAPRAPSIHPVVDDLPVEPRSAGTKPLAAPSVRARALELGVDLRQVPASAAGGRISHADLDRWIASGRSAQDHMSRSRSTEVEEVRIIGMRRKIAEKMALSKRHIPHITIVEEVEMESLEELRAALNAKHSGQGGSQRPKLTVIPFLMRAIVEAVREQPGINSHFDDEAGVIRRYGGVHIGIATQTPQGLNVPVIHNAEASSLWNNARKLAHLAKVAREGSVKRDELSGSTITITSLGALGVIAFTPIINHPEVAIVGVNKMQMRPVWDGQQFRPRKMMNISCSFDHRVIDGWEGAIFVQKLKNLLEVPAMLFVEN